MRAGGLKGATLAAAALLAGMGAGIGTIGHSAERASDSMQQFNRAMAERGGKAPAVSNAMMEKFRRAMFGGSTTGGFSGPIGGRHHPPSGWTNRGYQRAARKARNVARNRRAHRG